MRLTYATCGWRRIGLSWAVLSVLWLSVSASGADQPRPDDIWRAAGRDDVDDLRRFLSADRASVNGLDEKGFAPLHRAACGGAVNAVRLLCQFGADPNVQQARFKGTPLQYAATFGHTQVIRALLDNGACVDATDKYGRTPLMWAAMRGNAQVAGLLLDRGANVNAQSRGGTALHLAVDRKHAETAKLLIDRGADTAARNALGKTPAELNPAGLVLPDGSRADKNDLNYLQRRKLEGSWQVVSCRLGGKALEVAPGCRFTFKGTEVTVVEKTGSIKSRYALDARKQPKGITLSAISRSSKPSVNGAYSLEKVTLVICLALQPNAPVPTELETTEGDGRLLVTLRRMPGSPSGQQENGQTDRPK